MFCYIFSLFMTWMLNKIILMYNKHLEFSKINCISLLYPLVSLLSKLIPGINFLHWFKKNNHYYSLYDSCKVLNWYRFHNMSPVRLLTLTTMSNRSTVFTTDHRSIWHLIWPFGSVSHWQQVVVSLCWCSIEYSFQFFSSCMTFSWYIYCCHSVHTAANYTML